MCIDNNTVHFQYNYF